MLNTAPYFDSVLVDQTVDITASKTYSLPPITDDDGDTVTWSATLSSGLPLPSFITISADTFVMTPTLFSDLGLYTVTVTLDDTIITADYTFKITVINLPPKLGAG